MADGELRASIAGSACTALTVIVDALPPALRYGVARRLLNVGLAAVAPRRLPVVPTGAAPTDPEHPRPDRKSDRPTLKCVLATGRLGVGGVESVVATLARELPSWGVDATVMCSGGGPTADELVRAGVTVLEARDAVEAGRVLDSVAPDVVELHNAPDHMTEAATSRRIPVVPVVHNQEIHRPAVAWRALAAMTEDATVTVAVSETVRQHHLHHLPGLSPAAVRVVPNGAPPAGPSQWSPDARRRARELLSTAVGMDLTGAVVLLCLARYDPQKNIPGLVVAFVDAAARRDRLHLVVAGATSDRLEVCRTEAVRRSHPQGGHVHLLDSSSARTLLAAADALVLDSFFEGGPLVAAEALMVGLPVVLADAGAAVDFVGDGERGILVPNPAGRAGAVDDRRVRAARRRVARQRNRAALTDALVEVHDDADLWAARRGEIAAQAAELFGMNAMVAGHAAALRATRGRKG